MICPFPSQSSLNFFNYFQNPQVCINAKGLVEKMQRPFWERTLRISCQDEKNYGSKLTHLHYRSCNCPQFSKIKGFLARFQLVTRPKAQDHALRSSRRPKTHEDVTERRIRMGEETVVAYLRNRDLNGVNEENRGNIQDSLPRLESINFRTH